MVYFALQEQPPPPSKEAKGSHLVRTKTTKYPELTIHQDQENMDRLVSALQVAEPPVYATQGEDVGEKRGRKQKQHGDVDKSDTPNQPAKRRRTQANLRQTGGQGRKRKSISQTQTSKALKGGKKKRKTTKKTRKTAKARAVEAYKAELAQGRDPALRSRTVPTPVRAASSSSSKRSKANKQDKPKHDKGGNGITPPEHIIPHHVYSSAYKKCIAAGNDKAAARQQARDASDYFQSTGLVDDRCGTFRETRRVDVGVPRPAKAGWHVWNYSELFG